MAVTIMFELKKNHACSLVIHECDNRHQAELMCKRFEATEGKYDAKRAVILYDSSLDDRPNCKDIE